MKIYNTKTRTLETFKPLKSSEVKVYYCGPTVYNYAHIWNLKTSVVEDVVVRTLKYLGYNVKTTMNITDVDDKTIRDSMSAGETLENFTQKYTKEFLSDIEKLSVEQADTIQPVTGIIPEMVRMIQTMLNRGYAYYADDGSIYYDISKFSDYGDLAHLDMKGLKSSVRIDNDEYDKDHVADFVLWKARKPEDGENHWSPEFTVSNTSSNEKTKITIKWRPGWHIECSACIMKFFGKQIDIHMWGEDLIFPHHQNEIAQSEACTGKELAKYWIHSWHLLVWGKKMSKSKGNFYNLRDIESHFSDTDSGVLYRALRLSFMSGNYRDTIDFSFEKLNQLITTIDNIDSHAKTLSRYSSEETQVSKYFSDAQQVFITDYIEALENDFAIPQALSVFFDFQKFIGLQVHSGELTSGELQSAIDMYQTFNEVLGILDMKLFTQTQDIPPHIQDKFESRNTAKQEKNFELADSLRQEIESEWYQIHDTRNGSHLEKIG